MAVAELGGKQEEGGAQVMIAEIKVKRRAIVLSFTVGTTHRFYRRVSRAAVSCVSQQVWNE